MRKCNVSARWASNASNHFRLAAEAAFKGQLADFQTIHIAAHGIASAKFPDRAALVLGNDPQSGQDGLLQVREIRDLNLAADLVTLSACDTGVGTLEGEQGIARLVRSESSRFLDTGPRATDCNCARGQLARRFRTSMYFPQHGIDRGSRQSKIRNSRIKLFYWVGFVMVGDGNGIAFIPRQCQRVYFDSTG
jgi:hypothetical protein